MATTDKGTCCEICDTAVGGLSFCLSCKQNFCENCQKCHLRTALTRHHKFASEDDFSRNVDYELCAKHQQEITFYCNTCSKTTCPVCLTEIHNKHDLSWVNQLVTDIKNEIKIQVAEKRKQAEETENYLCRLNSNIENYKKQSKEQIKKTVKGWMDNLKSVEKDLIEMIREATVAETKSIEEKINSLEIEKQKLSRELYDIDVKLRTSSDASILEQKPDLLTQISKLVMPNSSEIKPHLPSLSFRKASEDEVKRQLTSKDVPVTDTSDSPSPTVDLQERAVEKRLSRDTEPDTSICEDVPDPSDSEQCATQQQRPLEGSLRDVLQTVNKLSVEESVTDIALVSDSRAWIGTASHISLVDTNGDIIVQFRHDNGENGTSVTSRSSGDALFVSGETLIKRTDQKAVVDNFMDLSPKKIYHIRTSRLSDDVFVATDHDILRFSQDGQLKQSLNCKALALTELSDGRLFAIGDENKLVCFSQAGECIVVNHSICWTWNRFLTALSSDTLDRIVVGNPGGKQIRVYELRENELKLQKEYQVDTSYKGIFSLNVHDGRIWLGLCMKGIIIAEYSGQAS